MVTNFSFSVKMMVNDHQTSPKQLQKDGMGPVLLREYDGGRAAIMGT